MMEEKTTRKLPPLVEVLIITVIVFVISLLRGALASQIIEQITSGRMAVSQASILLTAINLIVGSLGLFLGGVICFKLIEKRSIHWGILLLISVAYQLVMWISGTLVNSYVARFGVNALEIYANVRANLSPVLAAVVMTLAVYLLTAQKGKISDTSPLQISLFAHVLLLLLTGGIWDLIWIYHTTRYLNCVPGEEYRNPATKLLLCMFVPFYSIYWVYKSAQRIDKLAQTMGVLSDLAIVCLILEIFVPMVPPILMQDKINKILERNTNTAEF